MVCFAARRRPAFRACRIRGGVLRFFGVGGPDELGTCHASLTLREWTIRDFYRGWRRPGPVPPGGVEPEEGETLDFICGHFRIFQYAKGHRYSTDDVLTAWYGTAHAPRVDRAADLGSGIGSVALISAWRLPGATFCTVEAQEMSIRLARKTHGVQRPDVALHALPRRSARRFGARERSAVRSRHRLAALLSARHRDEPRITRRPCRRGSKCAARWRITRRRRRGSSRRAGCSRSSFRPRRSIARCRRRRGGAEARSAGATSCSRKATRR